MIVLPGGGYWVLSPHEGEPYVQWLAQLGISAHVFDYPVATRHPGPLQAIRAEVRRVRAAGAHRVGLLGSSAGGHAAGLAALDPDDAPVDLAMLCYPVVSMVDGHLGSRRDLLGLDADPDLQRRTSLDSAVTPAAPPFFIWHTTEDAAVSALESYRLGSALLAAGVPHEVHVFEHGEHGLALAESTAGARQWPTLAIDWLRRHGWLR